mmetsp:Transcript_24848/g.37763  ORF Transcript_24848/g.37763 Transcript_24848/m.37763 type:complete len:92 (+) Transcript_24848:140-415(+)
MENLFPYYLEEGIQHDLCWATDYPAQSMEECEDMIQQHIGPGKEVVWFTNPSWCRFAPEIDHIHILSRSMTDDGDMDDLKEISADAVFGGV